MNFNEKLKLKCVEKNNRLCLGLDIDNNSLKNNSLDYMNSYIKDIIISTVDLCPVYKINFSFYERYGSKGYKILEKIPEYINGDSISIADAKRGDIGNSSKFYAESIFNYLGYDSVTVSPYMGADSIEPFINYKNKGIFVLALTSNPGSNNFQKKYVNNKELYKHVIEMCNELNKHNNIGLVIGTTNDDELDEVNLVSNSIPWLMPGIGFQGGNLEKSLLIGEKNYLSLVNVSRGILNFKDREISDIRQATVDYTSKIREIL
jgi:orotidine-5'-phosphate decarboxylase|tara:strand:- start:10770 stop:11555 length:786 start_codon:yes stop_codon:yes gene_type:complete